MGRLATYDMVSNPAYVSGNGQPEEIPALHFQLTDPLGTRRMQTSDVGQPETDIQSLPYGDQLSSYPDQYAPATADDATPLHFTGKERDAESGNDYFGARYYASTMGRFLSPDWAAKAEPVPYAKLGDPQTLNLYAYVGNNPLTGIDPDGHMGLENFCAASGAGSPPCGALAASNKAKGAATPDQQQTNGASPATSVASAVNGGSVLDALGKLEKFFDLGGLFKDSVNDQSWYNYWKSTNNLRQQELDFDQSGSWSSDPERIQLDHAEVNLAQAWMGYYRTAMMLNINTAAGGENVPGVGSSILWGMMHGPGGIDYMTQQFWAAHDAYVGQLRWSSTQ